MSGDFPLRPAVGVACLPMHALDAGHQALIDEFQALAKRVAEQRERAVRLRALADHADEQATRDECMLSDLQAALGMADQLQLDDLDPRLRGQRLEAVALEMLRRAEDPTEPIHYREWFAMLRARGHLVAGKDPLASFLAQINRSPAVERVGQRTGMYRLRAVA